jgi:NAD(P)-dependent dehydrogenase (short-subunit alcohol dehydrogenase family)
MAPKESTPESMSGASASTLLPVRLTISSTASSETDGVPVQVTEATGVAAQASDAPRGLENAICVIGGASRGIGQGIAVRFAKARATVCVLGRSDGKIVTGPGTLSDVVEQIESVGGKGLAVQCDLRDPAQVAAAVQKIIALHGRVDVLVNNASALYPVGVEAVDEKRFDLMNHVCVRGTFLLTREVMPHMVHSPSPHVLTVAPAPIGDRTWMGPHTCYSGTKFWDGDAGSSMVGGA